MSADGAKWMERALSLAALGRYTTHPNPRVGAVLVRDGAVVGEGFHARAGEPHAEVRALRAAGERARGADMYVSLEPCDHQGRTGPCTQAIIRAGVRRVFVAAIDPNPRVAGRGVARLRAAGIEVTTGVLGDRAHALNRSFERWVTTGQPWVTLKLATSLDGRIAARTGASRWITGEEARAEVHVSRAEHDAVMVGIGTAIADDPRLSVRGVAGLAPGLPPRQPARVVVDSRGRLDLGARVLEGAHEGARVIVATAGAPADRATQLRAAGAEVLALPRSDDRVDLRALMGALGEREITSVLVEGGGTLAAALVQADLVDELQIFCAPLLLGGDGLGALGSLGVDHPSEAPRFAIDSVTSLGGDLRIIAHPTVRSRGRERPPMHSARSQEE